MTRLNKIFSLLLLFLGMAFTAQAQVELESFEGWDGADSEWLPEGWTKEHTDEYIPTLADGQFTWHVMDPKTQKSMPDATDGKYYVGIGFAKDGNGDLYQDEWLLSPAYKLSEYGGTVNFDLFYSPLYLFDVSTSNIDFDNMDFYERRSSADLQILVRRMLDNGEWDEYWSLFGSLYADWYTMFYSSLISAFSTIDYHQHDTVFLTDEEYHNATVQIAFRYVGVGGYNMAIDKFRMGYATNVTGVKGVNDNDNNNDNYYDLQGRVLRYPQGIYIKNGQKTLRR